MRRLEIMSLSSHIGYLRPRMRIRGTHSFIAAYTKSLNKSKPSSMPVVAVRSDHGLQCNKCLVCQICFAIIVHIVCLYVTCLTASFAKCIFLVLFPLFKGTIKLNNDTLNFIFLNVQALFYFLIFHFINMYLIMINITQWFTYF